MARFYSRQRSMISQLRVVSTACGRVTHSHTHRRGARLDRVRRQRGLYIIVRQNRLPARTGGARPQIRLLGRPAGPTRAGAIKVFERARAPVVSSGARSTRFAIASCAVLRIPGLDCSKHAKPRWRQLNLPDLFLAAILSELKINTINVSKLGMNMGIGGGRLPARRAQCVAQGTRHVPEFRKAE